MGVVHGSDLVCFVYQPWEVNDIQCLPYVSTSNLRMLTTLPSDNSAIILYIYVYLQVLGQSQVLHVVYVHAQVTCTCIMRGYDMPGL